MEVVSTGDGDEDDGVIWFKCPQCQGYLPKLSGGDLTEESETETPGKSEASAAAPSVDQQDGADGEEDAMPWDSPADMMAALAAKDESTGAVADSSAKTGPVFAPEDEPVLAPDVDDLPLDLIDDEGDEDEEPAEKDVSGVDPAEPIMEYAALLAEKDVAEAVPYRHWGTYEVGQCIHHLAWDDCGVVVAKEKLPGGRQVIKVYFQEAGVVRLIEQAPR